MKKDWRLQLGRSYTDEDKNDRETDLPIGWPGCAALHKGSTMSKGVFVTRIDPEYDDLPELRYHFPKTYLRKAKDCVGDWILYYQPRRNRGSQSYFATARVTRIEPDPRLPDHYYAIVNDYLEFPDSVPFRDGDTFYESALRNPSGSVNLGLFQRAVHHIPDNEYQLIVSRGLRVSLPESLCDSSSAVSATK